MRAGSDKRPALLINFIDRTIGLYSKSLISFLKLSILEGNKRFQMLNQGVDLEIEREIWESENFAY